jgi:protein-tyrosine kinase
MTKIYEALEQAQDTHKAPEAPPEARPEASIAKRHPLPSPFSLIDMEQEMIRLYQSLRSFLSDSESRVIQIIGSREGEGVSTVAREFARVSATRFNRSVLLVDADRSRPGQSILPSNSGYGWDEVIQKNKPIEEAFRHDGEGFALSTICQGSHSISQVFNSPEMNAFLEKIRKRFNLILIDSPPATTYPDGLAISSRVDGVILVVESEKTRWPVVANLKDNITRTGGTVLGIVMNKKRYYIPNFIYKRL